MSINGQQIVESFRYAIQFVPVTLLLTIVPLMTGFLFGTVIAVVRVYRIKVVSNIIDILVTILKGIPSTLIILMTSLIFTNTFDKIANRFGWSIHSKDIDMIYIAFFALTISSSVMLSESIRGALLSVSKGQYEAADSVGLSKFQGFIRIIAPQAVLVLIPTLAGNMIGLLKGTSIVFLLGVQEVLNSALKTATASYCFLEAYIAAAIIYWGLGILIESLGRVLERRFGVYRRNVA